MAELSENKKYMSLDGFRVSYRKTDDTIHLTSTDEAFTKEGFHLTLKDGSPTELALRNLLTENGIIAEDVVEKWPSPAVDTISFAETTWDKIPLGIAVEGQVNWATDLVAHTLVSGSTGSGKSVLQRNIFLHLAKHKDNWHFVGINSKKAELDSLIQIAPEIVLETATNIRDAVATLREAKAVLTARYELMIKYGVLHIKDVRIRPEEEENDLRSIMIMIEDASTLFRLQGNIDDDILRVEAQKLALDIACMGRTAGIHLLISSQEPAETYMNSSLKSNLDVRIAVGRHSSTNSALTLGNNEATKIDSSVRGRAIVSINNVMHNIQFPFQK